MDPSVEDEDTFVADQCLPGAAAGEVDFALKSLRNIFLTRRKNDSVVDPRSTVSFVNVPGTLTGGLVADLGPNGHRNILGEIVDFQI